MHRRQGWSRVASKLVVVACLGLLMRPRTGVAVVSRQLANLNAGAGASALPRNFGAFDSLVLFGATSDSFRTDLWRTDGTETGTFQVVDSAICRDMNPSNYCDLGAFALFIGRDDGAGEELWRTDGTPSGTWLVKDIEPGATGSLERGGTAPTRWIVALGDKAVFNPTTTAEGNELWVTDGTDAGTMLLAGRPGGLSGQPDHFTTLAGVAYFAFTDTVEGREVWRTDGTVAGTWRVTSIAPGSTSPSPDPRYLTAHDGFVYFTALDSPHGRDLADGRDGVRGARRRHPSRRLRLVCEVADVVCAGTLLRGRRRRPRQATVRQRWNPGRYAHRVRLAPHVVAAAGPDHGVRGRRRVRCA